MLDLGDPISLAATAALIILAFVPMVSSHLAQPSRSFDLSLTITAADESQWGGFPLPPQDPEPATRVLYPYSIIPGGVQGAGELKSAVANDPVVAEHYADFQPSKAHRITVSEDELRYVSYRIGSEIFWTKRRLRIPRGETLISDGQYEARTRCGNRLSETPESPVSPKEPPSETLEQAPAPEVAILETPPLNFTFTPSPAPPEPTVQPPERGHIIIPPIIPIWWGAGPPGAPGVPAPPPPIPTPEPDTWMLVALGILALLILQRCTQRRAGQN